MATKGTLIFCAGIIVNLLFISQGFCVAPYDQEPNLALAKSWWPDQRNVWTPIGWKDHYFRFNVLYNGTLIFEPCSDMTSRVHAKEWKGQDVQLTFTPWPDLNIPPLPKEQTPLWKLDGGHGLQGWRTDCQTPVLWTDFPLQEGMVIRKEVFGHLQGGKEVSTGLEPLYAWIRLSVTHVDPLRAPAKFPMIVQLSRNYHALVGRFMNENGVTIDVVPERAHYVKELQSETFAEIEKPGLQVVEPDGRVRLAVLPAAKGKVTFHERAKGIYALQVNLDAKVGDHVDLLLPMFPQPREAIQSELWLGFGGALGQSEAHWASKPDTAARFDVPEQEITDAIAWNVKFAQLITEKDPQTGDYSFLSGSWGYDQLWPTPTSMNSHMFLSLLGRHDLVERYSDIFLKHQGKIKAPGPVYALHPGYFGTPRYLTSIDWLTDHGAVLLQVSTDALLTRNEQFTAKWTEPIVKACEFLKDYCAKTNHDGVIGLLPPAVATDEIIPNQAIWNLAWSYKGLTKAVQLLQAIKHPRANEFDAFAKQFKNTFVKAYREAASRAPRWKDSSGREYPKPPALFSKGEPPYHVYSDAFYLDTGPMVLVWSGLLPADDPLMQASAKFFREGPNWKLKGPRFNPIHRPVLEHEMSTCEPCYSWNVVHSWELGDRENYLQGMYSLFAGSLSQQTYIACEHRHGMQGNLFSTALAFWMARQAVIDDDISPGELHLLRLCPSAWLSSERESVFEKMPTVFGPVNLHCKRSADKKTLHVQFEGKWHNAPGKIVLHSPPLPELETIVVNGKSYQAGKPILVRE
jgi:hypothetical protein